MEMPEIKAVWSVKADRESLRAEVAMRVLLSWEPQASPQTTGDMRGAACGWAVEWADSLLAALERKQ